MTRSARDLRGRTEPSGKRLRTKAEPPRGKPTHPLTVERRAKPPNQSPVVLTVGHSTRTLKEFVVLLLAHGVKQLIDVRTIPRSRHNPQFNRDRLPRPLQKAGIRYRHMAGLGGLRHARRDSINTAWRNASFRGFADYMQTPEFQEALDQLIELAKKTANRNHVCRSRTLAMSSLTDRRCTSGSRRSSGGNRKPDAHAAPRSDPVGPGEEEATLLPWQSRRHSDCREGHLTVLTCSEVVSISGASQAMRRMLLNSPSRNSLRIPCPAGFTSAFGS